MARAASGLTDKQERFVAEYLIDLNATKAAIRAGYSEKTANEQGSRLLANAKVAAAVDIAMQRRAERTEVRQDEVVRELARIGFSDIRKLLTDNESLRAISSLDDDTAAAVSSIEVVTRPSGETDEGGRPILDHVHKIRLWDKNSALEKLGKHLAMFTDVQRHDVSDPLAALLEVVAENGKRVGT